MAGVPSGEGGPALTRVLLAPLWDAMAVLCGAPWHWRPADVLRLWASARRGGGQR